MFALAYCMFACWHVVGLYTLLDDNLCMQVARLHTHVHDIDAHACRISALLTHTTPHTTDPALLRSVQCTYGSRLARAALHSRVRYLRVCLACIALACLVVRVTSTFITQSLPHMLGCEMRQYVWCGLGTRLSNERIRTLNGRTREKYFSRASVRIFRYR